MHGTRIPRAVARMLIIAPLLVCTTHHAHAQNGRPAQNPPAPPPRTHDASSSHMQVELPTPVAETPVPLIGRGSEIQTLSFVTPDTKIGRAHV